MAVIGHQGSCQPECIETRTVVVPPNVFYKARARQSDSRGGKLSRLRNAQVRVEVAQVDMHSEDEQVSVKAGQSATQTWGFTSALRLQVGGQQVTCSPKVASDYNCSLVEPSLHLASTCNFIGLKPWLLGGRVYSPMCQECYLFW